MIFDIRMYIVVGIFIIVCISLMLFNFIIIYYIRGQNAEPSPRKIKKWNDVLYKQLVVVDGKKPSESKHQKLLLRKLQDPDQLVAYAHVLQYIKKEFPDSYSNYVDYSYVAFNKLADIYRRKPTIERTCYANFISNFPETVGSVHGNLVDTLISYIDDYSIHCRTNVVCALCNIGSVQGVVNALQVVSDRSLFIHNQTLTNALSHFAGDKEVLGCHLWSEGKYWNDNILVSVIQFITKFSNNYNEIFLPILQNDSTDTDVRAAIIRYYGKSIYEPARTILIKLISSPIAIKLIYEAGSALALYNLHTLRPGVPLLQGVAILEEINNETGSASILQIPHDLEPGVPLLQGAAILEEMNSEVGSASILQIPHVLEPDVPLLQGTAMLEEMNSEAGSASILQIPHVLEPDAAFVESVVLQEEMSSEELVV